jgi:carbon storage regulator
MLVLTRRLGEEIIIGDGIRIKVVAVGPSKVRLGITAPPQITVNRLEVHQRQDLLATAVESAKEVSVCS